MSKNKGKYNEGKDQAVAPEAQIAISWSMRTMQALRPHALKIVAVVGAIIVVLIGLSIWSWAGNRRQTRASQAFEKVMDLAQAEVVETPAPVAESGATPQFKTYKERSEAALKAVDDLEREHGAADLAPRTRILRGSLLYDLGRFDEAIAAYQSFLGTNPPVEFAYIAREGMVFADEAKALAAPDAAARTAGLEKTLKGYEALVPDEKAPNFDRALYHQARIHALLGKKDKAIELYQRIVDKFPATALRRDVDNRLVLLKEQG